MSDTARRRKIVIDNENFYLIIGKNFVHATTPYENRPDNMKLRSIVDQLCETITEELERYEPVEAD